MENINELKRQQSEKHPGFGSYLECMTRALFTGLAAFTLGLQSLIPRILTDGWEEPLSRYRSIVTLGVERASCIPPATHSRESSTTVDRAFSGSFIGQSLLKNKVPYGRNGSILISSLLAVGASYQVTSQRTKACQAAWMASEDKHTYLKDMPANT